MWPRCREIAVAGELDLAVSGELRRAIERAVDRGEHVMLDLSECDFIDSSGLAVLVHGHEALRAGGRELLLYGSAGQVQRMLTITGLTAKLRSAEAPASPQEAAARVAAGSAP
jgi:anti-sigma B factor antagonist